MATLYEYDEEQAQGLEEWLEDRPDIIKEMAAKFPGNRLYRLKNSGDRVTIYSYHEDGTLSVSVTGEYNFIMFDRNVFGIKQDDLEECDLPAEDELVGCILTDEKQIDNYIKSLKLDRKGKA